MRDESRGGGATPSFLSEECVTRSILPLPAPRRSPPRPRRTHALYICMSFNSSAVGGRCGLRGWPHGAAVGAHARCVCPPVLLAPSQPKRMQPLLSKVDSGRIPERRGGAVPICLWLCEAPQQMVLRPRTIAAQTERYPSADGRFRVAAGASRAKAPICVWETCTADCRWHRSLVHGSLTHIGALARDAPATASHRPSADGYLSVWAAMA